MTPQTSSACRPRWRPSAARSRPIADRLLRAGRRLRLGARRFLAAFALATARSTVTTAPGPTAEPRRRSVLMCLATASSPPSVLGLAQEGDDLAVSGLDGVGDGMSVAPPARLPVGHASGSEIDLTMATEVNE